MIFTDIKRIKAHIIERERPFWKIYQQDNKNLIGESLDIENLNCQKSAELLETEINELDGKGYVIVRLYSKPTTRGGDNSNAFTYYVKINGSDDSQVNNNNPGMNNFNMIAGFYDKINDLNIKLINQENDARIKEIERKFDDKNKAGAIDPLLKEVLGFAKIALAGNQNKNNPGVNTSQNIVNEKQTASRPINGIDDKNEFVNLIKKWHQLDPNYIEAIKAIVHFAETDRSMYDMQVNLLINQYKSK